jgi:hypothetical protein
MTLKEKFAAVLYQTKPHFVSIDSKECEQIADDFAIVFAEWLEINKQDINYSKNHNTKELLEIYKKEKGL